MRIENLRVQGLFELFDHSLSFKTDERILIMIGPNGYGKTSILRLIDILFNQSLTRLNGILFREVVVSFDDGSRLIVTRDIRKSERPTRQDSQLTISFRSVAGKERTYQPKMMIRPQDISVPLSTIEDIIPDLIQVSPRTWQDQRNGEIVDLNDLVTYYADELPFDVHQRTLSVPSWLEEIRQKISVRYIDTERLTRSNGRNSVRRRPYRVRATPRYAIRAVLHYSDELSKRVKSVLADYGTLSQSLDRTFPVRFVRDTNTAEYSMDTLQSDLDVIETKRSSLVEAGILAEEQAGLEIPSLDRVDESRLRVLSVYAQDANKKLSTFDDLYRRVNAFLTIANSRFRHKQLSVGAEGLRVVTADGADLDLERLSSGEQHELVILYELLFETPDGAVILIDEPELSLHVVWQEQFLKDLDAMAKLSNFRAIVATHSPEIIADRWDLAVQLKGSGDA